MGRKKMVEVGNGDVERKETETGNIPDFVAGSWLGILD